MRKNAYTGLTSIAMGFACIASQGACSPATRPDSGPERGIGNIGRLTSQEWTAYVGNGQYVRNLAPPDVAVKLNFADSQQYEFVKARLKLAGKTAENSPHLFELIEARRQLQIASGLNAGRFAQVLDTPPAGRVEMHYIEVNSIGLPPANLAARTVKESASLPSPEAVGAASSTFPGGTDDTYVDISVSTVTGTPIAPLQYKEEFENPDGVPGANVTSATTGNTNASNITRFTFESYKYEDVPGQGFSDSYIHQEAGSLTPQPNGGLPVLSLPQVDAPADIVGVNGAGPDGLISVCMDRQWTNDCDYIIDTGSVIDHRIKMPLKGFITILTSHVFDRVKIDQLIATLKAGGTDPGQGQVKLVLTNVGGGCDVDASNALYTGMSGFWNYVTLSADNKTFYWDLTGANSAFFDQGCTQIQNRAKLTMKIPLPMMAIGTNTPYSSGFTISNDPATQRPDYTLLPVTLTNSCLAEGTQIQLGDGKLAGIESLHIGQEVFNPYAASHQALTIKDTAKGVERSPMVRIRDAAGHTLLMTEMHPIATADRGMVQARALRTGDVVMTRQGPSKLVEVSREPYAGQVYNLKVGSEAETASLGHDQTVVYANGFMVGDGQIQSKYEELSLKQGARIGVEQIPEPWRRDYLRSPHHN